MEGVLKWGEIEINSSHTAELFSAINAGLAKMNEAEAHWSGVLVQCLHNMIAEPALYLMVEKGSMKKKLVVTVGNGMMGDDAAGPLLAEKLKLAPLNR